MAEESHHQKAVRVLRAAFFVPSSPKPRNAFHFASLSGVLAAGGVLVVFFLSLLIRNKMFFNRSPFIYVKNTMTIHLKHDLEARLRRFPQILQRLPELIEEQIALEERRAQRLANPPAKPADAMEDPCIPCEKLRDIRGRLGFSTRDLAAVLRVTRPTVYQWLRSEGKAINDAHRERIDLLHRLITGAKDLSIDWHVIFLAQPERKDEWLTRLSAENLDAAGLETAIREMDREAAELVSSRQKELGLAYDPNRTVDQQEEALGSIPSR